MFVCIFVIAFILYTSIFVYRCVQINVIDLGSNSGTSICTTTCAASASCNFILLELFIRSFIFSFVFRAKSAELFVDCISYYFCPATCNNLWLRRNILGRYMCGTPKHLWNIAWFWHSKNICHIFLWWFLNFVKWLFGGFLTMK